MACTSGLKNAGPPGIPPPGDPPAAGQLDPLAAPAAYTAAPTTWAAGSKPALRTAANSPQVSEDPHIPPAPIPAIRAPATAGSSSPTLPA